MGLVLIEADLGVDPGEQRPGGHGHQCGPRASPVTHHEPERQRSEAQEASAGWETIPRPVPEHHAHREGTRHEEQVRTGAPEPPAPGQREEGPEACGEDPGQGERREPEARRHAVPPLHPGLIDVAIPPPRQRVPELEPRH